MEHRETTLSLKKTDLDRQRDREKKRQRQKQRKGNIQPWWLSG